MRTINLELLEDANKDDINELYLSYEKILRERKILNPGQKDKVNLTGSFDEDEWILTREMTDTYAYINFAQFDRLIFKGLKKKDIITIKLWVADMLTREKNILPGTILNRVNIIYEIMEYTNCFNEQFLEQDGNPIEDWKNNSSRAEKGIVGGLHGLIEYLEYRDERIEELDENLELYLNIARKACQKISIIDNPRNLPKSKDITAFSYYLEKFFNENKDSDLEIFYYPVLIWWKVTNVIPMRISELCRKLIRDCLFYENEKIFLKLDRVKKNRNPKKYQLPTLDKVEINNEIADMIKYYIDITDKFGKTNTLFSYRAYNKIKDNLNENYKDINLKTATDAKFNEDNFSYEIFQRVLDSFYDYAIGKIYEDSVIENRIKPTDTRHFAFFSLMLQGLSPIEIALLGGHTSLKAQENYQYEVVYYMDSNLYKLLDRNNISKENRRESHIKTIKEIISNMSEDPPKSLVECRELEVGYCTFDFTSEEDACEDFDDCCFCSKFWCAPNAQNYKKKLDMITNKALSMIKGDLRKNTEFLSYLMNDIKINPIQCCDDVDVCMDRNELIKIRTTCNQIKHNTICINKLRYSMIDLEQLDNKLESVIKSIENTLK